MWRHLPNSPAWVAAAACAAIVALWVRSYSVAEGFRAAPTWHARPSVMGIGFEVKSLDGAIEVTRYYSGSPRDGETLARVDFGGRHYWSVLAASRFGPAFSVLDNPRYPFNPFPGASVPAFSTERFMIFDGWLALPLAVLAAAAWLWRWRVRHRSASAALAGRCPACGYDLRATPGRYPECGRLTA